MSKIFVSNEKKWMKNKIKITIPILDVGCVVEELQKWTSKFVSCSDSHDFISKFEFNFYWVEVFSSWWLTLLFPQQPGRLFLNTFLFIDIYLSIISSVRLSFILFLICWIWAKPPSLTASWRQWREQGWWQPIGPKQHVRLRHVFYFYFFILTYIYTIG